MKKHLPAPGDGRAGAVPRRRPILMLPEARSGHSLAEDSAGSLRGQLPTKLFNVRLSFNALKSPMLTWQTGPEPFESLSRKGGFPKCSIIARERSSLRSLHRSQSLKYIRQGEL
jgi:hypothetical protein